MNPSSLIPFLKHFIYFIIGLAIAFLITICVVLKYADPIADYLLKKGISNATDQLYNIKYKRLDFDFLKGNLQITGLQIKADSLIFKQQKTADIAPENLFDIKSDTLIIENISWLRLLAFNFYASSARVINPSILATQIAKPSPANNPETNTDKTFDQITLGELIIKEGNVLVVDTLKKTKHKTENINLKIKDLKASFDEDLETRKRFDATDAQLDFNALFTHLNNSQDIVQIGRFSYSNTDQQLTVNNLSLNKTIPADVQAEKINKINIPAINISGADLLYAWKNENLIVKTVKIDRADFNLVFEKANNDKDTVDFANLQQYIKPVFHTVSIDTLLLQEASLYIDLKSKGAVTMHSAEKISIRAEQIRIDSTTRNKPQQYYYAHNVLLDVDNYSTNLGSKLYDLNLNKLQLLGEDNTIKLRGLQFTPRHSKTEFSKHIAFRTDRITFDAEQINIKDLNFKKLISGKAMLIDKIEISNAVLEAFRDVSVDIKKEEKPLPHIALQKLSTDLAIKKVTISNTDIIYEELQEGNPDAAQIELKDTYATITNITNRKTDLKQNNKLEAQINTMLMGQSKISSKVEVDLKSDKGKYSFKGDMEKFDLSQLNPLLIPMAKIKATEGVIEKMDFEILADNDYAIGNMNVYYNNLKLDLVNKDGEKEGFAKKAGTVLLNNLAIKSKNTADNKFRPGMVDCIRKKNTSIFNHWAKSLVSGLLSSLTTRPAEAISKKQVIRNDEEYQQ